MASARRSLLPLYFPASRDVINKRFDFVLFVMYLHDKQSLCCCPSKDPCFCIENCHRLKPRSLVAKTQLYVLISLKQNFYVHQVDLIDFDIVKRTNNQKPPSRVKTKDNSWPVMHYGSAENLTHSSNYDIGTLPPPASPILQIKA